MVQQVIQLGKDKRSCSICLDLLKDPVTIPCGHSYCMSCINACWDEDTEETHSCPQCRQTFPQRPVLVKNTMLAELVEEVKLLEAQAASADPPEAGPEDVACDFCCGQKLKALKSCLVCMASFCDQHLQPHYAVAGLKKHQLVEATSKLQDNICSRHDEVMKMYCRTDQQCICYLCSVDEHKGHDTLSAAAERAERQTQLGLSRQKIQQRVQDAERDVQLLQQRVEAFNLSADEAVRDSERSLTQLIRLMEKTRSEVTQQIRDQQKSQVSRATELEEKLQQEISDLRRRDTELEELSRSEDHLHFLRNYPSLSGLSPPGDRPSMDLCPLGSFKAVTAAVSELKDKLQAALREDWLSSSSAPTQVEVSAPPEPKTRAQFLRYSRKITLDPHTVNRDLLLSDGGRKIKVTYPEQVYTDHPDRFVDMWQVLSKEGLTGRCYWEVKRSGCVDVAVAYKDIRRRGSTEECGFGLNNRSWSLLCHSYGHTFRHNNTETSIPGPPSSVIGVYLDHEAGTLSFYRVSDTMTLLHRVQTRFTQPLYPGLGLYGPLSFLLYGDSAEFVDVQQSGGR
ncbi:tripartite motif-containing protein 16-like [Halichoeres trimaculatus]|uniref:tripartite motif-containing protein 16-like n=1 Tax=Halichoeres trimaculatus TaxID=147232 RepID=UPI003D9E6008